MAPLIIQVDPTDNVAIAVAAQGLAAGLQLPNGILVREAIPQAHKVALSDIAEGAPIIRYGEVIGHALQALPAGSWVNERHLSLPALPPIATLRYAPRPKPESSPIGGWTFLGYPNPDGSVGTKNLLGITTTVQCVAPTVDYAVAKLRAEVLPKYPNVDGIVALTHTYGCGVAIDAPDAAIPIRTIRNLALNPNLGGQPMVVSLGCEKLQPSRLFPTAPELPILSPIDDIVRLQDYRGFGEVVSRICEAAEKRLAELNRRQRVECPASALTVGLQCGGSDAFSGVTCNPVLGKAADLLVRAGATVMFSEVTEVRDAVHLLLPRCADQEVADALLREMHWYDSYLARGSADRSANPTPGNKRGGLANVVEKALGSVAKSGSSTIVEVLTHGERPTKKGLIFAATPASDFICGTQQLAAQMNMHVFTTGEGTPYGLAMAPVIKVSSRTALAEKWPDLIDFDAGVVATGHATLDLAGEQLVAMILAVASGTKVTWADRWGLHNSLSPFQPGPAT